MKNKTKYLVIILFCIVFNINTVLCIEDYSSGSEGSASGLGSGGWSNTYVGLKVNIISENKELQEAKVFVNKGSDLFFASLNSKILMPSDYVVKWAKRDYVKKINYLPSNWCNNANCTTMISMYRWLSNNNYKNLKDK